MQLSIYINMSIIAEANAYSAQAEMLKALGHPMRIAIIQLLRNEGEKSVGEIQEHLMVEQAIASHQLGLMKSKGLLLCRRDGRNMYYQVRNERIFQIIDCIEKCV